ncbi:MAG: biotin--protein ligase [Candidatus Marsarchaeota archaeon]|nr:biotin--protein ligase [Candidatus Marsarchaeota archaeon]
MKSFAEQKVVGGKLVSVKLEYGRKIKSIQILGDFFLHPEEALPRIEKALVGTSPRAKKDEISGKIAKVLAMNNAELIGVTPDAIAETIRMAAEAKK